MTLHDDAVAVLRSWCAPDAERERLRRDYLDFLATHPDGVWRSCRPEHLTASALVLDSDGRRALLTLHRKGGFWAQLGGHCEPGDETLVDAALREATEESGIAGLDVLAGPVDLDRHELSAAFGSCRAHLDVRYVAVAPAGAVERVSAESRELQWFDLDALLEAGGGAASVPEESDPAPGCRDAAPAYGAVVDLARLAASARAAFAAENSSIPS